MMEPLEKAAVLMTLMKRLGQIMDHERALLTSLRLDDLKELQEEKTALADAYEVELQRLRTTPETFAGLDDGVREQIESAMRRFQDATQNNLQALAAAQTVVDKVVRNIADGLARHRRGPCYQASGAGRRPAADGSGDFGRFQSETLRSAHGHLPPLVHPLERHFRLECRAGVDQFDRPQYRQRQYRRLQPKNPVAGIAHPRRPRVRRRGRRDRAPGRPVPVGEVRRQAAITGACPLSSTLITAAPRTPSAAHRAARISAARIGDLTAALEAFGNDHQTLAFAHDAVDRAEEIADTIHQIDTQVQSLRSEANRDIERLVDSINADLEIIDDLNNQIASVHNSGDQNPDLFDKRDLTLRQLAEKIEIDTYHQDDGSLAVYTVDGQALVDSTPRILHYSTAGEIAPDASLSPRCRSIARIRSIRPPAIHSTLPSASCWCPRACAPNSRRNCRTTPHPTPISDRQQARRRPAPGVGRDAGCEVFPG